MRSLLDVCQIRRDYRRLFTENPNAGVNDLIEVMHSNVFAACNHEDNRRIIDSLLSEMIEKFKIRKWGEYEVHCTKSMNTPELIDENKLWFRVALKNPLEIYDIIISS